MIHRPLVAAGLLAAAGALAGASPAALQQPTFRSEIAVVSVDVSVMAGNRPVDGLTADDLLLLDRDVPQRIELLLVDAVPVDVSVLVETNTTQLPSRWVPGDLRSVEALASRVAAMLRHDDRWRLLTFSSPLREVLPFQASPEKLTLEPTVRYLGSSLIDALVQVMMRPNETQRRHLIVAFAGGADTTSAVPPAALVDVAKRCDAVLDLILATEQPGSDRFREAAEATGGQLYRGGSADTIAQRFEGMLNQYRRGYLLRYTPQGVPREGWHELTVKVIRRGGERYSVRARKGYFVGP